MLFVRYRVCMVPATMALVARVTPGRHRGYTKTPLGGWGWRSDEVEEGVAVGDCTGVQSRRTGQGCESVPVVRVPDLQRSVMFGLYHRGYDEAGGVD
jgi:hypothetical protein